MLDVAQLGDSRTITVRRATLGPGHVAIYYRAGRYAHAKGATEALALERLLLSAAEGGSEDRCSCGELRDGDAFTRRCGACGRSTRYAF